MSISRRTLTVGTGALVASALVGSGPARAQNWPQRPVRILLTLGGGSGTDIGMRLLADRLQKRWSQPVVIENRPGGDGLVAISAVLSAKDDHVLLGSPSSSFTAHPYVIPNLPYRPDDLAPIARGWNVIIVVAVPESLPVNSMKELVALTRAQPGKFNWAGTTGAIDFLFAGFLKHNDLVMERVPYRNPQDAANDLATGRVHVCEASLATLRPQLEAGRIKLLAVTNTARTPSHPNLPTVQEAGYPELTLDGLVGLFGTQSLPIALRERIAADVQAVINDPIIIDRLTVTGQMLNFGSAAEFTKSINQQRATIAAAAKSLGIKALQ